MEKRSRVNAYPWFFTLVLTLRIFIPFFDDLTRKKHIDWFDLRQINLYPHGNVLYLICRKSTFAPPQTK